MLLLSFTMTTWQRKKFKFDRKKNKFYQEVVDKNVIRILILLELELKEIEERD